jgi:hypothetical protein
MCGNSWFQWLHHALWTLQSNTGRSGPRRSRRMRPWLEMLENRIAPTTIIAPDIADNTLYHVSSSDPTVQLSNAAGQNFFVGEVGLTGGGALRRGAIKFDLSGVPAGSTITSATLTLNMSRSRGGSQSVALHRALADWGEGTSTATASREGMGTARRPAMSRGTTRSFLRSCGPLRAEILWPVPACPRRSAA